ncbi:spore coat assembly protein SafA [compost metagenome]
MSPAETLKSGTTLLVPGAGASGAANALPGERTGTETAVRPAPTLTTHTVKRGETLFSIANRYGLTIAELRELNGMSGSSIQAGQKLRVKGTAAPAQEIQYHTVKAGETLFSISNRYSVSVEDLKYWNNMKTNTLMAGKKIIVKR